MYLVDMSSFHCPHLNLNMQILPNSRPIIWLRAALAILWVRQLVVGRIRTDYFNPLVSSVRTKHNCLLFCIYTACMFDHVEIYCIPLHTNEDAIWSVEAPNDQPFRNNPRGTTLFTSYLMVYQRSHSYFRTSIFIISTYCLCVSPAFLRNMNK